MDERLRQLRTDGKTLKPSIIIGKNGITAETIENIKKELLRRNLIKVKILGSFMEDKDKKEIAAEIAQKTGSQVVDLVGFTLLLARK